MVERSSSSSSSSGGGGGVAVAATLPTTSTSPETSSRSTSAPLAAELKADTATPSSAAKGKRVFVFQKRWLHSLPIVEKTLADAPSAVAESGKKGGGAEPTEPTSREVIACMLCDDPQQQQQAAAATSVTQPQSHGHHQLVKMWSRTNCRRGRIENHLTSKHPEFMLLLKHKRDSEGELAVQLFLQNMRDGRCSLRNEINLGLYTHIHALNAHAGADAVAAEAAVAAAAAAAAAVSASGSSVDPAAAAAAELKRGSPAYAFSRDSFAGIKAAQQFYSPLVGAGGVLKASLELLEAENRRKRARLSAPEPSDDVLTNGASSAVDLTADASTTPRDWQEPTLPLGVQSSDEMAVFAQWQSVFFNRLVVVTGGENEFVSSLATNFWLLGANVLLTFSSLPALKEFSASHAARYPDADSPSPESHRGLLLPLHCAFQTRKQVDEWSCSVADKFSRVDFLINFVDDDEGERRANGAGSHEAADGSDDSESSSVAGSSSEYLISSANRLLELCQSISALCFQPGGSGSIVNITTQSDGVKMNWAAVETLTKSLAMELQPLSVQVNCILLERLSDAESTRQATGSDQPAVSEAQRLAAQEQQNAALSHTILFLLSPASAAVSGSVLRLQHRTWATRSDAITIPHGGSTVETAKPAPVDHGDALESVNEVV